MTDKSLVGHKRPLFAFDLNHSYLTHRSLKHPQQQYSFRRLIFDLLHPKAMRAKTEGGMTGLDSVFPQ